MKTCTFENEFEKRNAQGRTYQHLVAKQNKNRFYNHAFDQHIVRKNFIIKILRPLIKKAEYDMMTLYMTIAIMDAFLSKRNLPVEWLPSIGVVSLSLASKLNEFFYIGIQKHFFQEMEKSLALEHFPDIEKALLFDLEFDLNVVTPHHFLRLFLDLGIVFNDIDWLSASGKTILKSLLFEIQFVVSTDYEINKFNSLSVALSLIMIVRKIIGHKIILPETLKKVADLDESHVINCFSFCWKLIDLNLQENDEILDLLNIFQVGLRKEVELDSSNYFEL